MKFGFLAALALLATACTSPAVRQRPAVANPQMRRSSARARSRDRRLRPRPRRRQAAVEAGRRLLRPRERHVVRHLFDIPDDRSSFGIFTRLDETLAAARARDHRAGRRLASGAGLARAEDRRLLRELHGRGRHREPTASRRCAPSSIRIAAAASQQGHRRRCSARRAISPRSTSGLAAGSQESRCLHRRDRRRAASACRTATTT